MIELREECLKRIDDIDKKLKQLTGSIITISYMIDNKKEDFTGRDDSKNSKNKGLRVDCEVKLDENGKIVEVVSAKKVKFSNSNREVTYTVYQYSEQIENEEEMNLSDIDMGKLEKSLSFYQDNRIVEILQQNKKTYIDFLQLMDTSTRIPISSPYLISSDNRVYDMIGNTFMSAKNITLPTGECLTLVRPDFKEIGRASDKLKDDLMLTGGNNGFGAAYYFMDCLRIGIDPTFGEFYIDLPEKTKKTMQHRVTLQELNDLYDNKSPEEISKLAETYNNKKSRLSEIFLEFREMKKFEEKHKSKSLLPYQDKLAQLETQLEQYKGFTGFFRRIIKRKDYNEVTTSIEQQKRINQRTESEYQYEEKKIEENNAEKERLQQEIEELVQYFSENKEAALATRVAKLQKEAEIIRTQKEQNGQIK